MKRNIFLQLTVVATSFVVIAPALAAEHSSTVLDTVLAAAATLELTDPTSSASVPTEEAPIAANSGLLCGLTQSDVSDIINHYDLDPNLSAMAAALQTPFDCGAYGQLCNTVTPTQAHAYACGVWNNLKAHTAAVDVHAAAHGFLNNWAIECEVTDWTEAFCEEACSPYDVVHCNSIEVNGECKPLAICADLDRLNIKFLSFLDL